VNRLSHFLSSANLALANRSAIPSRMNQARARSVPGAGLPHSSAAIHASSRKAKFCKSIAAASAIRAKSNAGENANGQRALDCADSQDQAVRRGCTQRRQAGHNLRVASASAHQLAPQSPIEPDRAARMRCLETNRPRRRTRVRRQDDCARAALRRRARVLPGLAIGAKWPCVKSIFERVQISEVDRRQDRPRYMK
jgi:hypothetical protein